MVSVTAYSPVNVEDARLSCENLACAREERLIFRHLGFSLQNGSLLIVKGANGTGKTSLLRMLCGLVPPYEGTVEWNNTSIVNNAAYYENLCFIGHKNALRLDLNVEENLRFWARLAGGEMLLPVALRYFGLQQARDVPCLQLSAGWRRRVALSRLLLKPYALWLLDEPTNFLDDEAVTLFTALVETRVQQGGIVVIASHSIGSAFASHTLALEDFT